MQNFKKLGQFIKLLREERNISQEEMAKSLDVSKSTVSLYESGERKPSLKRLTNIAEILEIPLGKLLELEAVKADIDIALRAEGISNEDIKRIKNYIKLIKDSERLGQENNKK